MIIADFKRDAENKIIALDAEGNETCLDFAYVAEHKPQVGDDYPAHEIVEEATEEVTEEPAAPAA
jgi:hypothetical protein